MMFYYFYTSSSLLISKFFRIGSLWVGLRNFSILLFMCLFIVLNIATVLRLFGIDFALLIYQNVDYKFVRHICCQLMLSSTKAQIIAGADRYIFYSQLSLCTLDVCQGTLKFDTNLDMFCHYYYYPFRRSLIAEYDNVCLFLNTYYCSAYTSSSNCLGYLNSTANYYFFNYKSYGLFKFCGHSMFYFCVYVMNDVMLEHNDISINTYFLWQDYNIRLFCLDFSIFVVKNVLWSFGAGT